MYNVFDMFEIPEDEIRQQAAKDSVTHFASGVAVVRDDKILIVRRVPDDFMGGIWELPGGGIDDGETFANGVARELLEETGLKVTTTIGVFDGFDYQTPRKPKVRQVNVLVVVEPGEVILEPTEHDAHLWITSEDIDGLQETTDQMRTCLRDAFAALRT